MKTSALLLACFVPGFTFATDTPKSVAVAECPSPAEFQKTVGARVTAILKEHGISSIGMGNSLGVTVDVREDRAEEARRLLARAILSEKLNLLLLVPKGDGYEVVTPETILAPKKEK